MNKLERAPAKVSTGIAGLDDVLGGGLPRGRLYLLQGDPGVGKTTTAIQFLLEGVRNGERVLYISLSETRDELESVAESHGWSLEGIELYELSSIAEALSSASVQTVFRSSDVELTELIESLLRKVEEVSPARAVFDSLSELRLLAHDALRYRRQILALKQYFSESDCTVLLLDGLTSDGSDLQLQSIAHGVIALEQTPPSYGGDRRRMRVQKLRGVRFRSGYHDFNIDTGGIEVFPRLIAAEYRQPSEHETVSSDLEGLDKLLGGGLDRGVSTLFIGPAGVGKSTIGVQFAVAAAKRGEAAAIYSFEESPRTLYARSGAIGQEVERYIDAGLITFMQIDPAELTPGEFSHIVRKHVEQKNIRVAVIDSLNGYLNAMPEDKFLVLQLHELLSYLGLKGVATILIVAQHGMLGTAMSSPIDISYLADSVLLFRFYEFNGHIRKALSAIKRRSGSHEHAIRELVIASGQGIEIGPPLEQFRGILTGVPTYLGEPRHVPEDRLAQSS